MQSANTVSATAAPSNGLLAGTASPPTSGSGIANNPNRPDAPGYIVRLIGQVVAVSLETVRLVRELSALPLLPDQAR